MNRSARSIQRIYLTLTFGNILASSLIWGINTLFLLDAGLTNFEAFAANAFFTAGMVLFEIPTGIVADIWGRRTSYLLGTVTLSLATALYYLLWQLHAPFWEWAGVSLLLGLGFTFFSGAVEAWLVDALAASGYKDDLEAVFGRGQIVGGIGMLVGSVSGGIIAQYTSLGFPFILRALILGLMFVVAWSVMRDIGFTPDKSQRPLAAIKHLFVTSFKGGLGHPKVRWLMLAAPFSAGIGIYAFYAAQPFLLELYGDPHAYTIAGLAAAIIAGSQMAGGFLSPKFRALPFGRVTLLILGTIASVVSLVLLGLVSNFYAALGLLIIWGMLFAAVTPIRQSYLNHLIDSKQRATILSFDSLMGNVGSVVTQPLLGRAADVWSYGTSFVFSALVQAVAIPLLVKLRIEDRGMRNPKTK